MAKNKPDCMRTREEAENDLTLKVDTTRITVDAYNILRMLSSVLGDEDIAAIVIAACGPGPLKYSSVVRHG